MVDADEPSDFELLRKFLLAPARQFGIVTVTASDLDTLAATRAEAARVVSDAGRRLAMLDVQPGSSILDQMVAVAADADVLFVDHLERVLFDSLGGPTVTADIELLNWDRDRLPKVLHAHTVLWLLPSAAHALALVARDLNDVIMARYRFETGGPTIRLTPTLATATSFQVDSPPLAAQHLARLDEVLKSLPPDSPRWPDIASERGTEALRTGDLEVATRLFERTAQLYGAIGSPAGIARAKSGLAAVASKRGDRKAAVAILRGVQLPDRPTPATLRARTLIAGQLAAALREDGQLAEAHAVAEEQLMPAAVATRDPTLLAMAKLTMARILASEGQPSAALRTLDGVSTAMQQAGNIQQAHAAARLNAELTAMTGEKDRALQLMRDEVIGLGQQVGDEREESIDLAITAELLQACGFNEHASSAFKQAYELALRRPENGDLAVHLAERLRGLETTPQTS